MRMTIFKLKKTMALNFETISSSNFFKKTVGIMAIFGAVYVVYFLFIKKPNFDDTLIKTAIELNKNCPQMVDKETRLDNARAIPGNIFQYNYTLLNFNKDSMDVELYKASIEPMIVNNASTNADLEPFRKNKVTLIYSFKDDLGNFVTRILVTPEKYGN